MREAYAHVNVWCSVGEQNVLPNDFESDGTFYYFDSDLQKWLEALLSKFLFDRLILRPDWEGS